MLVLVGRGLSLRAPAFGSCRGDAAGRSTGPTRIAVHPPGGAGLRRIVIVSLALIAVVAAGVAAFTVSPWPSVLLIRLAFHKHAVDRSRALQKHVPANVTAVRDLHYGGADAFLDVFYPSEHQNDEQLLPAIVWIHGGAFVGGDKSDVASYLEILAGRGYTAIGINYSLAPGARYPAPVIQANQALSFLNAYADRLHVDPRRLFLAGAQIASQLAAAVVDPSYAESLGISPAVEPAQIEGVALFCGVYDVSQIDRRGSFGGVLETVVWSYFGRRDVTADPRLAEFSVIRHVTQEFPPAFISAGNADPLAPQSVAVADAIRAHGVAVTEVFFPPDYTRALPHEYQFDLDGAAGRRTLQRLTTWLDERARAGGSEDAPHR